MAVGVIIVRQIITLTRLVLRCQGPKCHGLVSPDRGVLKRAASVPNDCYNSDY